MTHVTVLSNCSLCTPRVKLAVHKETHECVAVKVVLVDGSNGLTRENLRKEVLGHNGAYVVFE